MACYKSLYKAAINLSLSTAYLAFVWHSKFSAQNWNSEWVY